MQKIKDHCFLLTLSSNPEFLGISKGPAECKTKTVFSRQPLSRLRTVPTNLKVFLRGLLNMREKQILKVLSKSIKKIEGNHAFFEDN